MEDSEPIPTPGIEPTSMDSYSPPTSPPQNPMWGDKDAKDAKLAEHENDAEVTKLPEILQEAQKEEVAVAETREKGRKRIVVVGLGMVGIAFM